MQALDTCRAECRPAEGRNRRAEPAPAAAIPGSASHTCRQPTARYGTARRWRRLPASPMMVPIEHCRGSKAKAKGEPRQKPVEARPDGAEMQRIAHGSVTWSSAELLGNPIFGSGGDLPNHRLVRRLVEREVGAGHRLAQRHIDEIQPVRIPLLDDARIGLWSSSCNRNST